MNKLEQFNSNTSEYINDTYEAELRAARNKTDLCFWTNVIIGSKYKPQLMSKAELTQIRTSILFAMDAQYKKYREAK